MKRSGSPPASAPTPVFRLEEVGQQLDVSDAWAESQIPPAPSLEDGSVETTGYFTPDSTTGQIDLAGFSTSAPDVCASCVEPFIYDRPRFTPRTAIVPDGRVVVELGARYSDMSDDEPFAPANEFSIADFSGDFLIRYGLRDLPIELRGYLSGGNVKAEYEIPPFSFSDNLGFLQGTVGAKWRIGDQRGASPAQALIGDIGAGTIDDYNETLWRIQWVASWAWGDGWAFDASLGGGNLNVEDDVEAGGIFSLLLEKRFGEDWSTFVELFTTGGDNLLQFALLRRISDNSQLDIAAGFRSFYVKDFWMPGSDGEFDGGTVSVGYSYWWN